MRDFPQEVSSDPLSEDHESNANGMIPQRSRFAFAQKRVERPTNANVNQIQAAHTHRSPVDRSRVPIPIKTTLDTVPRVAGPRPRRSKPPSRARREPTLAVPKPVHPLPTWLTHFEVYENEFIAEFCPPSKDSSPSTSSFPSMARVELPSEHFPECPPLSTVPLLGFSDSDSGLSDTELGGGCSEEGGDCYEEDGDYVPFEFDIDSELGSDCVSFWSESSTPASYGVSAFDWPTPYQGQVTDEEGSSGVSAVTHPESPPSSGPHVPPLGPFDLAAQPPGSLPWSVFTNPFTGAPIATSPSRPSVASVSADGRLAETDADRLLAEIEEGLGSGSVSTPGSFETNSEGWYDRFDPTGYTFPVLPQQSHQDSVAAGFATPPLVYTATIPLPDTEEEEDPELDAVVIVPRSPAFWWR